VTDVWKFFVSSPVANHTRVQALLAGLATDDSGERPKHPVIHQRDFASGDASFLRIDPYWMDQSFGRCWDDSFNPRAAPSDVPISMVAIDHVAVWVAAEGRDATLKNIEALFGPALNQPIGTLQSLAPRIAFSSMAVGDMDVNLISPLEPIPHLRPFQSTSPRGGVLHLGISVGSMSAAIDLCRRNGIELISDRLRAKGSNLPAAAQERFRGLVDTGFAEERTPTGVLRQTFAFPADAPGQPFVEFVERRNFPGYGEKISSLLVAALDAIS